MNLKHFTILALLPFFAGTALSESTEPNVVLINCDDLGWAEIGSYGQKKIKTPNLDKLASEGQRWNQFYSGAPTCSPSRNVLMTGRHSGCDDVRDLLRVDNSETWDDLKGDWPISDKAYTLPSALKKKGYITGLFGKWGLGEYGTTGAPDKHGFDSFYGYTDQRLCHTFYPKFLWNNGKKDVINEPGIVGHLTKPEGEVKAEDYRGQNHSSDLIIDRAVQFIKEKSKLNKPFFMYYAPLEPHVAMQPTQQWIDLYPKEWDKAPYRGENGYLPHPRPRAGYAGMISQMDHNVGRIMEALQQAKVADNTIIIFTSDNGTTHDVGGVDNKFFDSVRGLKGLKGQVYEGGIRVPCIMVWPGKIKPGSVTDQPGYAADIMPTLCGIIGADPGKPRGSVLTPVMTGKADALPGRAPMIWAGGAYGGQIAVRIGDKKVLRRQLAPGKKSPLNWEVYDIKNDPTESKDLSRTEPELINTVRDLLDKEYTPAPNFQRLRYEILEKDSTKTAAAEAK